MSNLTLERLYEVVLYFPQTGEFHLRGDCRTFIDNHGYRIIVIDGRLYKASRLAWLYMQKRWHIYEIDHRNHNPGDDRWNNLREATRAQNGVNRRVHRHSRSGIKGVDQINSGWRTRIKINGKNRHLGMFETPEAAAEAFREASFSLYGEFACVEGRSP